MINKYSKTKKPINEAKDEFIMRVYGIGFILYFIFIILLLPFEIIYHYVLHLLGKEK